MFKSELMTLPSHLPQLLAPWSVLISEICTKFHAVVCATKRAFILVLLSFNNVLVFCCCHITLPNIILWPHSCVGQRSGTMWIRCAGAHWVKSKASVRPAVLIWFSGPPSKLTVVGRIVVEPRFMCLTHTEAKQLKHQSLEHRKVYCKS